MNEKQTLKSKVTQAIRLEPLLIGVQIDVVADGNVVTLSGTVDSYFKKRVAEHVANNIQGVKVVIEKIKVEFASDKKKTDQILDSEILQAIEGCTELFENNINAKVDNGRVTLEGNVTSTSQKDTAESTIYHLHGVRMITNNISVRVESDDLIEKAMIEDEVLRNWVLNNEEIEISVLGHQVTLRGKVHSVYQRNTAERIAWNAPGILNVHNKLTVQ